MASLAADPIWKQSDREPGVPIHDGQKERIPGQRHDLGKCTLHRRNPYTGNQVRVGPCAAAITGSTRSIESSSVMATMSNASAAHAGSAPYLSIGTRTPIPERFSFLPARGQPPELPPPA
jgi:hypothetical protein